MNEHISIAHQETRMACVDGMYIKDSNVTSDSL